jgi:hypothetical protein
MKSAHSGAANGGLEALFAGLFVCYTTVFVMVFGPPIL